MSATYNLIYYIGAVDRPMMWFNLWHLKQNLYRFNGKKIITIAQAGDDDSTRELCELTPTEYESSVVNRDILMDRIISYLDDDDIEFYAVDNSELTNTIAIRDNFSMVSSLREDEFTFYGHTIGIRYNMNHERIPGIIVRSGIMNVFCFTDDVQNSLVNSPYDSHGALKYDVPEFGWTESGSIDWHYSGAFYWVRHSAFFGKDWKCDDNNRCVIEYMLGRVIPSQRAACTFDPIFNHPGDVYNPRAWQKYAQSIGTTMTEEVQKYGWDGTEETGFTFSKHLEQVTT